MSLLNSKGEPRLFLLAWEGQEKPSAVTPGKRAGEQSPPMSQSEVGEWLRRRGLWHYLRDARRVLRYLEIMPAGTRVRFEPRRRKNGTTHPQDWTWLEIERRWTTPENLARQQHLWALEQAGQKARWEVACQYDEDRAMERLYARKAEAQKTK